MGRSRSQTPPRSPRRDRRSKPSGGRREKEGAAAEPRKNGKEDGEKENNAESETTAAVVDERTWGLGRRAKKDAGDHPLSSGDEIELVDEDNNEMEELQKLMGIGGFSSTKLLDEADKVDLLGSISEKRAEERKLEREKPLHLRLKRKLTGGNGAPLLSALHKRRTDGRPPGRPPMLPQREPRPPPHGGNAGRSRGRSRSPRERRRSRSRSRDQKRRSRSRSRDRRRHSRERGGERRGDERRRDRDNRDSREKRKHRSRSPEGELGYV